MALLEKAWSGLACLDRNLYPHHRMVGAMARGIPSCSVCQPPLVVEHHVPDLTRMAPCRGVIIKDMTL